VYEHPDSFIKLLNISARRPNNIFKIPRPHKEVFRKNFQYLAPKFFNLLPVSIQQSISLSVFKKNLKIFVMNIGITDLENFF